MCDMNVGCRAQIKGEINCCFYLENHINKSFVFTGEQDESICKSYITQIKNLRVQIEDCESRTVARIRQPAGKDPLIDCSQKSAEQKVRQKNHCLPLNLSFPFIQVKTPVQLKYVYTYFNHICDCDE